MVTRLVTLVIVLSALAETAFAQAAAPPPADASTTAAPASNADFRRASRHVLALMEAVAQAPGAAPGMSVVMVQRGEPPVVWTHGTLAADTGVAVDADTPFYIASQTKAFIGLLGAKLDAESVFDLDQTLSDVWPNLVLPEGADPHIITFRDMLSHMGPFRTQALTFRTAYSDRVPVADYERLMSEGSIARAPGFSYLNLGYLVYAAALEVKTGRSWRDWLEQSVLRPSGLTRTSSRRADFPASASPRYHRWMADQGWDILEGKPDELMHAAGGLVTSPNDMARWLALQLGEPTPAFSPEVLHTAQTSFVPAPSSGAAYDCQTYTLGWFGCHLGTVDVLTHGGAFDGVRSMMAVSSDLGVGFAFMSNSDSLTGGLSQQMVKVFFESVQDANAPTPEPQDFADEYAANVRKYAEGRLQQIAQVRAEPRWEGWTWRPTDIDLAAYAGIYQNAKLGTFTVGSANGVTVKLGVRSLQAEPAAHDLFGLTDGRASAPEPFQFERVSDQVTAVTWNNERFERVR